MKKSLRVGAMVATAALATMTLASCGFGGGSDDDGDVTAPARRSTCSSPATPTTPRASGKTSSPGFEEANPDIDVKLEVQSWDNLD